MRFSPLPRIARIILALFGALALISPLPYVIILPGQAQDVFDKLKPRDIEIGTMVLSPNPVFSELILSGFLFAWRMLCGRSTYSLSTHH